MIFIFLKHFCARREDYASVEEVTEVAARYAMRHTETRWLIMKYVAVRIMQQMEKFKGIFFEVFTQGKQFQICSGKCGSL